MVGDDGDVGVVGLLPLHCEKARQTTIAPTLVVKVVTGVERLVT
jgi:hypothetical protein